MAASGCMGKGQMGKSRTAIGVLVLVGHLVAVVGVLGELMALSVVLVVPREARAVTMVAVAVLILLASVVGLMVAAGMAVVEAFA